MIRVAIIGCGNIANQHIKHLKRMSNIKVIGACDYSTERAKLFSTKHSIDYYSNSFETLLKECDPDVVHILTPSISHTELAIQALNMNCHVFVEKPLCSTMQEVDEFREAIKDSGKTLAVNHSLLFDPIYLKGKNYIKANVIGDIKHVDFVLSDDFLVKYKKGLSRPWVLTQKLNIYHDLLPHPLYLINDLIPDLKIDNVSTKYGKYNFPEMIQLFLQSPIGATATITISLNITPITQRLHVYGSNGNIQIDYRNFIDILEKNRALPQPLPRIIINISKSFQYFFQTIISYFKLATGKIHPYKGLFNSIDNFYASVTDDELPNLKSFDDGVRVVQLMTNIENLIHHDKKNKSNIISRINLGQKSHGATILVTGATGKLGSRLVAKLMSSGKKVRILVRESSDLSRLESNELEIVYGDLADIDKLQQTLDGIEIVYHCASTMEGEWHHHYTGTIQGTQKLLDICVNKKIKKFIHISSMGILDYSQLKTHALVNEDTSYESHQDKRGYYTKAKLIQEQLVLKYMKNHSLNITIIRPGIIIDSSRKSLLTDIGFKANKIVLHIGLKRRVLRFIEINKLVDYLITASKSKESNGKIYNALDNENMDSINYIKSLEPEHGNLLIIRMPLFFFIVTFSAIDYLLSKLPGQSKRNLVYKLKCMTKNLNYDTSLIQEEL
jgi:2-alkyl-3-oxoalkanoate reductase